VETIRVRLDKADRPGYEASLVKKPCFMSFQ